ncbi:glycosyltransferase family 2 protein [Acetobacter conturbans]|uniref:Glycosyl transferase family 2 n=1 Tax=Acetobacter conturbans TaxID=1737472 RepID=A0ABX0JYV9_9PROT|nr:glycosyltransferase family 2 protein [Acetobacter conturbans]NHN88526.1 hypothetical protein [Acetobacter conturbans]
MSQVLQSAYASPVARCITMQKNERTLLEPWLLHHASLFGFSALTVIDNGSDDPVVRNILRRYEKRGVTVIWDRTSRDDFIHKGDVIADVIRRWDREGGYDFAFPLDCDEFIVALTDHLAWDQRTVLSALETMSGRQATFINDRILLNVPSRPGYFLPQIVTRPVLAAGSIVSLDHGFHSARTIYPYHWVQAPLACLHLHNRPHFSDIQAAALEKLRHLIGDADPATVTPTLEGQHLYSYFQSTEEEFVQQYRDHADVYVPGIREHFERLGVDWRLLLGEGGVQLPLRPPAGYLVHSSADCESVHRFEQFDAAFYAHANPDVATDNFYGRWPLVHYVMNGWKEGRLPNAVSAEPIILKQAEA